MEMFIKPKANISLINSLARLIGDHKPSITQRVDSLMITFQVLDY